MATMFPCPNCGGQLRFSIKEQKLKCQSCGEFQEVGGYKPNDGINADNINTNIYICPNCNGEIQLIDNDGMEFCPFCGSQATMQEKFSNEGAPKYILPFKITKRQAKNRYIKATKNKHFAPEGLQDDENIDKLVGMYVPYYLYEYSLQDEITFKGSSSYYSGDYHITNRANVDVNVDVDSVKVPFDASQALDDTIAEKIEPFPTEEIQNFAPGYLAGFYVENSSVEKNLYQNESLDKTIDYMAEQVIHQAKGYTPDLGARADIETKLANDLKYTGTEGAYLPLYFMTTRHGDRVAYSIINGASGNTYVDLPIDKRKMFSFAIVASAIIFAALLFLSFVLSFSFKVKTLCSFGAFVSSLIGLIGAVLANKTYRADNHLDDKGYFQSIDNVKGKKIARKKNSKASGIVLTAVFAAIAIAIFLMFELSAEGLLKYVPVLFYPASVVMAIISLFKVKQGKKTVLLLGLLGWALSIGVRLLNPANDLFYYGVLICAFVVIIISVNAIVDEYNRFATHPSPHFLKKGGGLDSARD